MPESIVINKYGNLDARSRHIACDYNVEFAAKNGYFARNPENICE